MHGRRIIRIFRSSRLEPWAHADQLPQGAEAHAVLQARTLLAHPLHHGRELEVALPFG